MHIEPSRFILQFIFLCSFPSIVLSILLSERASLIYLLILPWRFSCLLPYCIKILFCSFLAILPYCTVESSSIFSLKIAGFCFLVCSVFCLFSPFGFNFHVVCLFLFVLISIFFILKVFLQFLEILISCSTTFLIGKLKI